MTLGISLALINLLELKQKYDRFGKILKILTHDSDGWDGIYIGHFMPETDYWFLARVKGYEEEFELRGHFALVRKLKP